MTRPLVFISYARVDADEMKHLCAHLGGCPEFEVWADTKLEGGEDWDRKIRDAIARADLTLLLVTAPFLNSRFIKEVEVPLILERHRRDGTTVYPVIGKDCVWDRQEWLCKFNVRPASGVPVWGESRQHADSHLARIAREVAQLIADRGKPAATLPAPQEAAAPARPEAAPLRTFDVHMPGLGLFATDARGALWACNGEQVKVFRVGKTEFQERWTVPDRRWKCYLTEVWGDRLVFADWDGSLYAFSGRSRASDQPLYQARDDDLPIHRLAVGPTGLLAAAAWDGRVRTWDAQGNQTGAGFRVAHLPTQVLPLADDFLAVADQAGYLRLINASGREVWSWRATGRLHSMWAWEERGDWAFLAQVGRTRLVKILAGSPRQEVAEFKEPIVTVARQTGGAGDEWAVVAREGGKLDWVCASSFLRVVRENHVDAPFTVRDIVCVRDPRRPTALFALGLTADGQLFSLEERAIRLHPTPGTVRRLALDPTGGFLFLLAEERACAIRNPAISPLLPRVEVDQVQGTLSVQAFQRVAVRLKNVGVPAIHEIRAELRSDGNIDPARPNRSPALPVLPGEGVELEFSVRARVPGRYVPLTLKLELADEGGPPWCVCDIQFDVESRADS